MRGQLLSLIKTMAKQRIRISELKIRLPRGLAGNARSIAEGIGREVIHAAANAAGGKRGSLRIDEISAGRASLSELPRNIIGSRVAAAVDRRLDEGAR